MVSSGVAPPPILVIGMHRSGTSATAGLLAHLGVFLGAPERMLPRDVHNPEGYHELRDVVALNDRLLDWCGSAWDLPPELGDPHLGQLQPPPDLVEQLKSLVASMDAEAAAAGRPWAVKDPRLSVLWPFWLQAKPTARVVLCVRNPASITQSLEIRNGLSLRFGLRLSEQYFEHLLSIPKERIEAQVRYEELVSDPEKVARDLVCNLRLESDIDQTRTAISSVKAELARNRGRLESMPASIDSHSISRAYARVLAHGPAPVDEPVNPPTLVIAPTSSPAGVAFENEGHCPICDRRTRFVAAELPMREHYRCEECGSLPRERALMLVIEREYPNWRSLRIHEFRPMGRPLSQRLQRECEGYCATDWLDDTGGGRRYGMYIAERLECLSFKPETFDLHITREVLKHLESPAAAFAEIARTLKPGGAHIFTVPLVRRDQPSRQRVRRTTEGLVEFLEPTVHHGNPKQPGTLVTMDWGYDIVSLIRDASGLETRIIDIDDLEHGVRGEYRDVLISTKPPQNASKSRRDAVPPRELQDWVGGGGPPMFNATGDEFLGYLVDLCGLQPGDAVLDVGCGSGRMALPLTGYLNREGRYAGFDVSAEAIAWCTENISGSHPNFDFTVVDIHNEACNPTGTIKSSDFRFPYPDESFDVVLLASLFTHMLPSDVKHYLHEIVRVLKPGGRSLLTFFLLNAESSALSTEGKASLDFEHEMPGYRMTHAENAEAAIAYPEAFVRWLHGECGLELREPLRYGTWCGRTNGMSGQDVVIAVKPARPDQTGGINSIDPDAIAELGRRPAAAGLRTASLDEVLGQGSSTSAATTPVEGSSPNACAPRLILAGHSNLWAIAGRDVYSESSELVACPRGDGTLIMVGPGPERDMSYFDTLAEGAMGADVGIIWGGNEHNACYLFEWETPFDFLSEHVRKMNPSAQMKSKTAIRDRLQQEIPKDLDLVLKRLAAAGPNRIALIGTPPPKGDNEALRALILTHQRFVDWAAQRGQSLETIPITDPYVQLKLWYLLQDMKAEVARTRGLMFIPVPKEVQDADGFLKREFWESDVSHGNAAYGNVMYEAVIQAFR